MRTGGAADIRKFCSFCGKHNLEVVALVVQGEIGICDECIELCRDIVGQSRPNSKDDMIARLERWSTGNSSLNRLRAASGLTS